MSTTTKSLCYEEAIQAREHNTITEHEFLSNLTAHLWGVRHPACVGPIQIDRVVDDTNSAAALVPIATSIRNLAVAIEDHPFEGSDLAALDDALSACLNGDLDSVRRNLEKVNPQPVELFQALAQLSMFKKHAGILHFCMSSDAPFGYIQAIDLSTKWYFGPIMPGVPGSTEWRSKIITKQELDKFLYGLYPKEVDRLGWLRDHGAIAQPSIVRYAAINGAPIGSVAVLLDMCGGAANLKNSGALQHAAARGNTEFVRLVLDAGADIDELPLADDPRDIGPLTALYEATNKGHIETTKLLLDRGANKYMQCRPYGTTALEEAKKQGGELAELFEEYHRKTIEKEDTPCSKGLPCSAASHYTLEQLQKYHRKAVEGMAEWIGEHHRKAVEEEDTPCSRGLPCSPTSHYMPEQLKEVFSVVNYFRVQG